MERPCKNKKCEKILPNAKEAFCSPECRYTHKTIQIPKIPKLNSKTKIVKVN